MSTFNFGITPTLAFEDVSATVAGEQVTLNTAAYDYTALDLTISAAALNACVIDVSMNDGDLSALAVDAAGVSSLANSDLVASAALIARLQYMAENSAKATIAYAVTGNEFGDIGELENDNTLSGVNLFSEANFKTAIVTAMKAVNGDAIVAVAEDIIRQLGLSDASGTDTGRDTAAPFEATDILHFNMLLCNGKIDIAVDGAHASVDGNSDQQGVEFFTGPVQKHPVGLTGTTVDTSGGRIHLNSANGDNKYVDGTSGASRGGNASTLKTSGDGYDNGASATGDFAGGSILVKFALTLN